MTDKELVVRKLALLALHLTRAQRRRGGDVESFRSSEDLQDALSMSVMVALQEAVDIAFHIAADEGWGVPASNAEAFALLSQRGVLPAELGASMATTVRLRNRLAHGYSTLDVDRLWHELPSGLGLLGEFNRAVAAWLESV